MVKSIEVTLGGSGRLHFHPTASNWHLDHDDSTIRLWNVATGLQIGEELRGHSDRVTVCCIFTRRQAIGIWISAIRRFDCGTWPLAFKLVKSFEVTLIWGHGLLHFHPTASNWHLDHTIRRFDCGTWPLAFKLVKSFEVTWFVSVSCIFTRRQGTGIWIIDWTIRLWNVATGLQIGEELEVTRLRHVCCSFTRRQAWHGSGDSTIHCGTWPPAFKLVKGFEVTLLRSVCCIFTRRQAVGIWIRRFDDSIVERDHRPSNW